MPLRVIKMNGPHERHMDHMDKGSELADLVKKAAYSYGADLVGVGNIGRWRDAPVERHPNSIFPQTRSVICIGFCIPRGVLRCADSDAYHAAYTVAGIANINTIIAPLVQHRICAMLENMGYDTVPVIFQSGKLSPPIFEEFNCAEVVREAVIDYKISAMLCGVGHIGLNRLLLTPQFGPAQRLFFLLTEAELAPDPVMESLCDGCGECIHSCPANALREDVDDSFALPEVGTVKRCGIIPHRCELSSSFGAFSPFAPVEVIDYARDICAADRVPAKEEILENVTQKVPYVMNAQKNFGCNGGLCSKCMYICLNHMHANGRLSKKAYPDTV